MFAFAGIWDCWMNKDTGEILETYAIITTKANELLNPEHGPKLHDRMPVILTKTDYEQWLASAEPSHLPLDPLRPYPSDEMQVWKVSTAVGNVRHDSPDLWKPI